VTKRILIAAAATAALATAAPAMAEDEPEATWSGFYGGATAGGSWGETSFHGQMITGNGMTAVPPGDLATINSFLSSGKVTKGGVSGGGEAGYDHRIGSLMLGAEADFTAFGLDQSRFGAFQSVLQVQPPVTFTIGQKMTTEWELTLRPRIGFVAGRWLFFGTFGLALSDVKLKTSYSNTATPPISFIHSTQSVEPGWAGGAGIGYQISRQWSIKGEWLYTHIGAVQDVAGAPNGLGTIISTGAPRINIVRVGVDYRF
jgi:outer membrane immunogenic protein